MFPGSCPARGADTGAADAQSRDLRRRRNADRQRRPARGRLGRDLPAFRARGRRTTRFAGRSGRGATSSCRSLLPPDLLGGSAARRSRRTGASCSSGTTCPRSAPSRACGRCSSASGRRGRRSCSPPPARRTRSSTTRSLAGVARPGPGRDDLKTTPSARSHTPTSSRPRWSDRTARPRPRPSWSATRPTTRRRRAQGGPGTVGVLLRRLSRGRPAGGRLHRGLPGPGGPAAPLRALAPGKVGAGRACRPRPRIGRALDAGRLGRTGPCRPNCAVTPSPRRAGRRRGSRRRACRTGSPRGGTASACRRAARLACARGRVCGPACSPASACAQHASLEQRPDAEQVVALASGHLHFRAIDLGTRSGGELCSRVLALALKPLVRAGGRGCVMEDHTSVRQGGDVAPDRLVRDIEAALANSVRRCNAAQSESRGR